MEFKHKSVLLKETIDNLNVKPDGIYVDGTLGGAGHASEVCKLLSATGRLIGIDQDDAAIQAASERLRDYQDRSWIMQNAVLRTGRMCLWICVWISGRPKLRKIS